MDEGQSMRLIKYSPQHVEREILPNRAMKQKGRLTQIATVSEPIERRNVLAQLSFCRIARGDRDGALLRMVKP